MYKIIGKYHGKKMEVYHGKKMEVDHAEDKETADYLVGEYQTFYGRQWQVSAEEVKDKDIENAEKRELARLKAKYESA